MNVQDINAIVQKVGVRAGVSAAAAMTNAPWLATAYDELGVREVAGGGRRNTNPRIREYLKSCWYTARHSDKVDLSSDSTAWCSAFVNWCLLKNGIKGTGNTWSLSWLNWKGGRNLGKDPRKAPPGSIVVMSRGKKGADQGHVAFLWSVEGGRVLYLGGNQGDGTLANSASDQVSIAHYKNEVLACIMPLRAITPPNKMWAEGRIV